MKLKNMLVKLLRQSSERQCSSDPRYGAGELTQDEVLAKLTEPSRIAFANLTHAAEIGGHPGYVWAQRRDVDLLLAEVAVSVGIEGDLAAAEHALVCIARLIDRKLGDSEQVIDKISDVVDQYLDHEVDAKSD